MNSALNAFINEITVDSKCLLNEMLAEFYKAAGMHFSFNDIREEEKVAMRKIAEEMNMNETFVNHFLEHFTEHITPLGLFEVVKHIDTVADSVDVRIGLEKIFKHPHATEHMKDYVKVWLMQPLQVMEKLQEFLAQMMFDDEQILNVALKDKTLFTKAVKKALIHPEDFNLVSFIVYNENDVPSRVHSHTEEVLALDIAGIVSVDDIRERIVSIKMDDVKGPETGLEGLHNATECLLKIHQAYPTMQANMINYSTRSINSSMMGGAKLSAARVVRLYAGDYTDYANAEHASEEEQIASEPKAENSAVRGLITNPEGFNALSASARRLVAQHLPATRKQFNQIIVNAINSVHTWMPQLINAKTSNRELNRVIDGLAKSYKSISGQQGMVDWFMHKFAPAVNAYRARGFAPTGIAVVDNVFGGSPIKSATHIYGSGMSGGVKNVYINRNENTSPHRVFGGGVIGDYFEGVRRAQIKFNGQFDDLYRKLTVAVRSVADKQQFSSEEGISRVIEALMSITIGSKKTVMKISGLRPKEDLNTRYTSMVEHVIKTIENTKLGGFGEVISILRSLVSLLKSVKSEAQQLIKRVSEGTKSSEEIVKYITFERDEIPSKLTPQELHALVESINALVYANHGHQLTPKIERHREENVKDYIKKITDRTEAINDYYEVRKDHWLKYTRNIDTDTRSFIKAHIKSVQSAMVYFNEKVDTKLMQWRQKMAKGGNITKKQIEDIERLTMTYMHYRPGEKILQIFGKLEKLRSEVKTRLTIGDIYKVTDVMHKIVMNAGYVEMIQDLYKVLEIDTDGFDWNLFKINLTKLLIDKIVCVDEQSFKFYLNETATTQGELFTEGDEERLGFSTAGLYEFATVLYKKIKGQAAFNEWGYNMLFNLVIAAFTSIGEKRSNIIASALNIESDIPLCGNYTMITKAVLRSATFNIPEDRFTGFKKVIAVENYSLHTNTYTEDTIDDTIKLLADVGIDGITSANIHTSFWAITDIDIADVDHQILRIKYAMLTHILYVLRRNKVYGIYTAAQLKSFIDAIYSSFMYKPANRDEVKDAFVILVNDTPHTGITWDGYFNSSRETTIIIDVFHAMIANVLYIFNRYIALRYTGSDTQLPVPMMTSAMLGGNLDDEFGVGSSMEGTKMDAGSAIDVIGVHDLKFDKVIPEAVPFYAIALDIFATFMTTIYSKYTADDDRPAEPEKESFNDKAFGMYVTISEFSLLHQLFDILKNYTTIGLVHDGSRTLNRDEYLAPLTEVQIKMIIAELNKVWNLVSGSGKEKLMNAIDYIIGEINASILFTSKNRYEQLKRDGYTDLDVSTKVEQQFNGLIDELQNVITENLKIVTKMKPDAMHDFESFLTISVEKVSKETNETARLNYVCEIINSGKSDIYKTPFEDYYKFCEFVITPIMITATSYKRLFDTLKGVNVSIEGDLLSMDLHGYTVAVVKDNAGITFGAVQRVETLIDESSVIKVTDICRAAHSATGLTGKYLGAAATLVNSPVVAQYNTILIKQALQRAFVNNQAFVMPEIWLPLIPSTYPREDKYVIKTNFHSIEQKGRVSDLIRSNITLRELYPNIKSDNIIDFANAMLRDFSADFDHLLHTFMTYPGISDRFLMQLKEVHENATTSLKNLMQEGLWNANTNLLESLQDKKLSSLSIASAPIYPQDLNIQAYTGTVNVPALSMQKTGSVQSDSYTMAGTGQVIHSLSLSTKQNLSTSGKQLCQYGPLDYIIYKIASCNSTGYALPVMLYELLKNNAVIGKHLVECAVDGMKVIYMPHSSGYVYNIVTQNILTRSATDRNRQESGELKNMNKTWLANLVSTIPGLISYITALAKTTEKGVVDYNGINIEQLSITLVTILESFYEECVPFMPFIPFMSDYVPGTYYSAIERKLSKYHSIAEIYQAIADPKDDLDGLKFEWANRPYYINGLQIPFPEYKNKDRFEAIKKWGGSIFQNSLFADEFTGTMNIIARAVVRSRIIRRNATAALITEEVINGDVNTSVDPIPLCLKTIKKCYEMDPVVIEKLINNIIRKLRATSAGMLGGYVSYAEAGRGNVTKDINKNPAVARIKELLEGIFTINGSVEGYKFTNTQSIESDINSAISLLYDNPNIRPFYGFSSDSDPGKEIYSSAGNLVFLHHPDNDVYGALRLAATSGKVTVDASTRGKELLAFSVVNQKPITQLADATKAYEYKGTIATSAKYANKNANPDLTFENYRGILKDSVYVPETIRDGLADANHALGDVFSDPTDTQKILREVIEGYANTSRLMIAANALSALGLNIMRLFSFNGILASAGDIPFNIKASYEIFNWLSLDKNGKMLMLKIGEDDGHAATAELIAETTIGGDAANDYTELVNYDATQIFNISRQTRWDKINGMGTTALRIAAINPWCDANAGNNAAANTNLFIDANKLSLGKLIRSLIYAVNDERLNSLALIMSAIMINADLALDSNTPVITAANIAAGAATVMQGTTDTSPLLGKNLQDGLTTGNNLFKSLVNIAAEPTNNAAMLTITNNSVLANYKRLIVLYALLTRRPKEIADQIVIDAADDDDGHRIAISAGSIITYFIKMLGFADANTFVAGDTTDGHPKIVAMLQLLGTVIEISLRTQTNENIITFTQIFGPKLVEYMKIIDLPHISFGTVAGLNNGGNYAAGLANALTSGTLAVALFDLFYNGSTPAKINALTKNGANNGFSVTNGTINGKLWSSVLGHANYENAYIAAAAAANDADRFVTDQGPQAYDIKTENYNFIPLKKDGDKFVPLIYDEDITVFNTKYTGYTPDANLDGFGFGGTSATLNKITLSATSTYIFRAAVGGDTFTTELYNRTANALTATNIGEANTLSQFIDLLRMLGYLSLVRSPAYNTIIVNGANNNIPYENLLLRSFAWQQFNNGFGFNVANAGIKVLSLLHNDPTRQDVIYNTHADLAIILANQPESLNLQQVVLDPVYTMGLTTNDGRFELSRAASFINDRLLSQYMYRYDTGSLIAALRYNAPAAATDIGTGDRIENNIRLTELPTIIPSIRPINKLTKESVKMYQLMPRAVAEYMLWNPGYEFANLITDVAVAERIHIPFDNIIEPAYSYPVEGSAFVDTKPAKLTINNINLLQYSLSAGLFSSSNIVTVGQNVPNWYNVFTGDVRQAGARNVNFIANHYISTLNSLKPDVNAVPGTINNDYDPSALIERLTSIIDNWCDSFNKRADKIVETEGWSLNMLGGDINFVSYIDKDKVAAGEPYKIYPSIYPTIESGDATTPGLKFYTKLFRNITKTTESIGSLALVYFNRTLLTFSGILSNFVYPNAIYGKSIFDRFADGLSKAISKISEKVYTNGKKLYSESEATKRRWDFYSLYAENFSKQVDTTYINASDRAFYAINQCMFDKDHTTRNHGIRKFDEMTITNLAGTFTHDFANNGTNITTNIQSKLSSEFTAPSICNSFLTILHNLLIGKVNAKNTNDTKDNLAKMEWFIGTDTMGALRSIDVLLTYTSVIASLIKQLSFYDMDEDEERTYIPRDPAEPFMGIEPENRF